MRTVLAALDTTPVARPVLETALAVSELFGAETEAIHVGDSPPKMLVELADHHQVPLRTCPGHAPEALLRELDSDTAVAVVIGARSTPGGRRPIGGTARWVSERTREPVIVVPPEADDTAGRPIRRMLVPLEGDQTSSRPITTRLRPLMVKDDTEMVVMHVFTTATMPRLLDDPGRDLDVLATEFLAEHCPHGQRVEWRTGAVATQVLEQCLHEAADLIVLSWSQDTSHGRAEVVREILSASTVPVLLLPVTGPARSGSAAHAGTYRRGQ